MSTTNPFRRTLVGALLLSVALAGGARVLGFQDPNAPGQNPPRQPPRDPSMRPPTALGQDQADPRRGHIPAPPGSESLATPLAANSVELFEGHDFEGTTSTLTASSAAPQSGGLSEMPKGLDDSLTSLRWNLEPGLIVVFYEDGSGKGEQLVIWGKGQAPTVSKWDFNDKASRWAWYDVGAGAPGSSAGGMRAPHGSEPLSTAVPENCVQMFVDKDFKNDMEQASPLTGQKPGEMHTMPKHVGDSLTSLRWNLPDGVIVMLYQDAGGKKQQVAIWGEAQMKDLDAWDFNDKASRWSWGYVGAPAR